MKKGGFYMNTPNKTIYFPKTVDSGNITAEWEKEYELEGNMPDIQRLLRIDSTPQISETEINKSSVQINGENVFNILYRSSEDEKIHSINISEPFSVTENIKTDSPSLIPLARIFCTFISCKVISPRKIFIKSKNKISLSIKENVEENIPNLDESKDILFFDTENVPMQTFLPPTTKTFDLEESLTVDGTYPAVDNVIFSSVKIVPLDLVKNISSATLNTTVVFKVFYENSGNYVMFSRSVPLSLTVEDDQIDENTLLYYFLSIKSQKLQVEMDNYGEDRILRFSYIPEIILFKVKESVEELPIDVFSPTDILDFKTKTVSFEELSGIQQRPFTIEKVFELPDTEFSEIYDTSAVMDVESFDNSNDGAILNGICGISVLGMTEKGIDSASFNVNFTQNFPEINDDTAKECTIIPIQANTMVTGRNMITVRISATATIRQYKTQNCSFLSEFSPISQREQRDKSCITIYYPSKTDTLWDISKEYGIDPKEIAKENKNSFAANGTLSENIKTIFIP